jgi:PAS domain S-box-containing protein
MRETLPDKRGAAPASAESGRGSAAHRINRALASMSVFSATAILTAVAIVLALALHAVIETAFYPAIQPATLISAAAVTILVAAPIVAYSQSLIRQIISSRATLREAMESLRRSREHLALAQRVAAIGSAERDLTTGKIEWSDETYHLFGVDRASFVFTDANLVALIHEEDRSWVSERVLRARRGIRPPPMEFRCVRPNGEIRTVYTDLDIVPDRAGKPARFVMVFKDVTELREGERQRKDIEAQLFHSQRLESVGTLAGGIAHDVNNMLVPILSLSKLMARRMAEGSRDRANLETILRASEHIRDLVGRILTFSRKDAPTRRTIDFAHLVHESLRMLRASIPSTIAIDEKIAPVPPLSGDPGQLHQIVTNLVTNAAHAIGDGMGTITVALAGTRDEGRAGAPSTEAVRLSVGDTGCGMDQATVTRIFEPFFTTKPSGVGTGLGLSVVHGIVAEHGGRIAVESQPGRGTCFTITLPAIDSGAVAAATQEALPAAG